MKRFIFPPLILGIFALIIVNYYANRDKGYEAEAVLLIDDAFFSSFIKDVYSAKSSVICSLYIFKMAYGDTADSNSQVTIIHNLLKDKSKHIDVTLIFDAGDDENKFNPNKQTAQLFKKTGVKVFFNEDGRKLYSKVCVIDKNITYIGSHNITFSSFELNHESTARIKSESFGKNAYDYLNTFIAK